MATEGFQPFNINSVLGEPNRSYLPQLAGYGPTVDLTQPTSFLDNPLDWLKQKGAFDSINPKDGTTIKGWGSSALTLGQGLLGAYMGMKQYGLMKDNLNFQKDSFYKNYEANKNLTNAQLADRQNRRNAEAGNLSRMTGTTVKPQDTASYLAQYGVK